MTSAEALVCLWAGTTRSIAGGDKWAEVPQSLWPFAWHYETGSAKKSCLKHPSRGWDFASWYSFQQGPGCDVLLWVRASWVSPTTEPMSRCRVSTRIKVSIPKQGSMANPIEKYNLRLNSPNYLSNLCPDNVLSLQPCIYLSCMALGEETSCSALTPWGTEPPFPQQSENERHIRT